jgi:hypothetical protein
VYTVYLYAVCLATVLVLLFSGASAVYAIVRIAAPGTTARGAFGGGALSFLGSLRDAFGGGGSAERDRGIVQLVQSGVLAIGAGLIFAIHWRWADRVRSEDRAAPAAKPSTRRKPSARAKSTGT